MTWTDLYAILPEELGERIEDAIDALWDEDKWSYADGVLQAVLPFKAELTNHGVSIEIEMNEDDTMPSYTWLVKRQSRFCLDLL